MRSPDEKDAGAKSDAAFARHACKLILEDLSGRKILGSAFSALITREVQEIKFAWRAIIERDIRLAVEQERERCLDVVRGIGKDEGAKFDNECPWGDAEFIIGHPDVADVGGESR